MSGQTTIDDYLAARATDPDTSHAAAASIVPHIPDLAQKVLDAVRDYEPNGATTEQIARSTQLSLVTVSPRMAPLEKAGLVTRTTERRMTSSGRSAIVWRAAQ